MKIYFATDHAGFELRDVLLPYVRDKLGYEVVDCGAYDFDKDDDYPDFITKAAKAVDDSNGADRAIIFGGSGQGEAIVANKFPNIRAAVFYGGSEALIRLSREHNDANVLSLGARFLTVGEAKRAVALWLDTEFSRAPRHIRRIEKISSSVSE